MPALASGPGKTLCQDVVPERPKEAWCSGCLTGWGPLLEVNSIGIHGSILWHHVHPVVVNNPSSDQMLNDRRGDARPRYPLVRSGLSSLGRLLIARA